MFSHNHNIILSQKVQLTTDEMPRHRHTYWAYLWRERGGHNLGGWDGGNVGYTGESSYSGGDRPHENRQAFVTAYQWKRVL